jgi:hypothetical protein
MSDQLVFESDADRTSATPLWEMCFDPPHQRWHLVNGVHTSRKIFPLSLFGAFWLSQFQRRGSLESPINSVIVEGSRLKTLEAFKAAYSLWATALQVPAIQCPRAAEGTLRETSTFSASEKMWQIWDSAGSVERLENAMRQSRWLLSLRDDWDDEGAQKYSSETLDRALLFLRNHMQWAREKYDAVFPIPRILPGPDGSIDLHWKCESFEVLLNIPPEPDLASFYGDDFGNAKIQGTFDPKVFNLGLLSWLIRR